METKYFQSKFNTIHKGAWNEIIKHLGINVYDVVVPCELAVIFGGFFENPSCFGDALTLVFYKTDNSKNGQYESWVETMKDCFDEMVDLTGLNIEQSSEKIRGVIEAYQS